MVKKRAVTTKRERDDLHAIRKMPIEATAVKRHAMTMQDVKSPLRGTPPIGAGKRLAADIVGLEGLV